MSAETGSFNGWTEQVELHQNPGQDWSVFINVPPGIHQVRPTVTAGNVLFMLVAYTYL